MPTDTPTLDQRTTAIAVASAAERTARRPRVLPWRSILKGLAGCAVLLALWQVARVIHVLNPIVAPSVWSIFSAVGSGFSQGLGSATWYTLEVTVLSVGIALAIGIPVGIAIGLSRWADASTRVTFDFLRAMPSVALLPVVIVMFGIGNTMEIPVVAFGALWPILYGAQYGVTGTETLLVDVGRISGLRRLAIIARIVLPSSLPSIATGLRLGAMIGLAAAVGIEVVVGTGSGIGYYIESAAAAGQNAPTYAGALVAGVLGALISVGLASIEGVVLRWNPGYR